MRPQRAPRHQFSEPSSGAAEAVARPATPEAAPAGRKLLIVSYHFPPDNRVGAVRPAKFAKYLRRFGWQPYVLTIAERHIPDPDLPRLDEVSDVPIVRTTVWPTATDALLGARKRIARIFRRTTAHVPREAASTAHASRREPSGKLRAMRDRLRTLLYSIFEFPDNEVGWVVPATWRAYRLMRRENIRVLLVTAPPRSSVLIGLALARLTGARLITDLRDPWLRRDRGAEPASRPERLRARIERRLLEQSNEVITTAERYTQLLRQQYPFIPANRFHTITNGYDAEDLDGLETVAPDRTFTLSYLGTFYWTRTPGPLLAALSDLVQTGAIDRDLLRVNFIGTVKDAEGESVEHLVRGYGLEGCVRLRGVVPYRQSLVEMKKSAVLVLIAPEVQYYGIPAKTFEYLAMRRPILCLGDRGATADLIRQTGAGVVVSLSNIYQIRQAVERLYRCWRDGAVPIRPFDITRFERERLTRQLADILG